MQIKSVALLGVMAFAAFLATQPATASVCGGNGDINVCKTLRGVGPAFTHYTDAFDLDDGTYTVEEYVTNSSGEAWTDYHIWLESFNATSGLWEASDDFDFIDFSGSVLNVDIDGVNQDPADWTGTVTFSPLDEIDFLFTGFAVQPGQVLSLHYAVSDFGDREWRLGQYATTTPVPVPGAAVLFGSALAGLAAFRRRG
jgi:hypothetical protein